jgi:hypothetical protein
VLPTILVHMQAGATVVHGIWLPHAASCLSIPPCRTYVYLESNADWLPRYRSAYHSRHMTVVYSLDTPVKLQCFTCCWRDPYIEW